MQTLTTFLLDFFSLDHLGLAAIFLIATLSATILPMGSEPVVFLYIKQSPENFWQAILWATAGNTLGGMITYSMGLATQKTITHLQGHPPHNPILLKWIQKVGPKGLFFSFLPVIGDPLCGIAGWLSFPWWQSLIYMCIGKLLRYLTLTTALLWVPNTFWQQLLDDLSKISH